MIVVQETTKWPQGLERANHSYVFESRPRGRTAQALAYQPAGTDRPVKFTKPITLDLKGRTFQLV